MCIHFYVWMSKGKQFASTVTLVLSWIPKQKSKEWEYKYKNIWFTDIPVRREYISETAAVQADAAVETQHGSLFSLVVSHICQA